MAKVIVLHFNDWWSTDDDWCFWLQCHGFSFSLGNLTQIHEQANNSRCISSDNNLFDHQLGIQRNLDWDWGAMKQLPIHLYQHFLKWEEKVDYSDDVSIVIAGSNTRISLQNAKKRLNGIYQYMYDAKQSLPSAFSTSVITLTIAHFKHFGDSGSIIYDKAHNCFKTNINGNCVDMLEAPLLPIIIQMMEKQTFLTDGQLGILRFISMYEIVLSLK